MLTLVVFIIQKYFYHNKFLELHIPKGVEDMKTIGMIGGMSWESSLEYYRIFNETVKAKLGGFHSAQCLMYSVDFAEVEHLQHANRWDELTAMMVAAARRLKAGGADFIVIATNTMHIMAADIEAQTGLPVLHIAEVTGRKIAAQGLHRVALLGTKFTMEGDFYRQVLRDQFGIGVIIPEAEERDLVHRVIYQELCLGVIHSESRAAYQKIIQGLAQRGAEGVILGCTEIPLLIHAGDVDIPVFDTTAIHAEAAVELALADEKN